VETLLFFPVAPHLLSQGLSGPRSRHTATQKNLVAPRIEPGTSGLAERKSDQRNKVLWHKFVSNNIISEQVIIQNLTLMQETK
jgi:hypothetical protein